MGNIKIEFIYSGKELSEEMIEGRKKKHGRIDEWTSARINELRILQMDERIDDKTKTWWTQADGNGRMNE